MSVSRESATEATRGTAAAPQPSSPSAEPRIDVRSGEDDASLAGGSAAVRSFYDEVGWKPGESGIAEDTNLFGVKEDGPIRQDLHRLRQQRVIDAIGAGSPSAERPADGSPSKPISIVECGCGGNPALFLARACTNYTGVDFSRTGLDLARKRLDAAGFSGATLVQAELGALPFADHTFDAAYSAHAIYHIPTADGQRRAFDEIMRVLKPGGVAVMVLANPRPLLFPARMLRRLLADTPGISHLLNKVRPPPPLPFKAMSLGWMRRTLARHGEVNITGYAIASVWFNQHVSEHRGLGRAAWKTFGRLERRHPRLSASAGNFVQVVARKK